MVSANADTHLPFRKALITGGNGNLGRLIASELLDRGVEVIKFDIPGTEPETTVANEIIITGDIRDKAALEAVFESHQPDAVIHLASLLSGSSAADPSAAWEINATASFELLTLANTFKVKQFFFASTMATYGTDVPDPMPEDTPQWPSNLYGATKVAVERAGVFFKLTHDLDFRCLRFPLVFSPFAPPSAVTAFPSHAFKAACQGGNADPFVFPVEPHVGVSSMLLDDVVQGTITFLFTDKDRLSQPAYSLHGYAVTAQEVLNEIQRRVPSFEGTFEVNDTVNTLLKGWPSVIVDDKARSDWGWSPKYDFVASADWLMSYFQANP